MRAVLLLFEAISDLKVNFHKSMLVGVNISESWLAEASSILNCKVGHVPFMYLGLSIEGNPSRLAFWDPVMHIIIVCVEKSFLVFWRSIDSAKICSHLIACLCSFFHQSYVRYYLFH